MPIYVFRCPEGHLDERYERDPETLGGCLSCGAPLKRDYRAEGVAVPGRDPRLHDPSYNMRDFLPTAKDFERPEDPKGERGMKEWMDTHEPRPGNKSPRWPTRSERQGV